MNTPAEISDKLRETDKQIKQYADMVVWFKAQRDYWRGKLEMEQKKLEISFAGPAAKAKAFGIANGGNETTVDMWWVPTELPLVDAVRVFDGAYDLVFSRNQYLHDHLTTLMVLNKNIMLDYGMGNR